MVLSDLSTMALDANASEEHASADVKVSATRLARSIPERLVQALRHETDASVGAGPRRSDTAVGTLPNGRQRGDDFSRIVDLPPLPPRRPPSVTLHALQEWEGYVVEIGETDFVARLVDLTAGATHEEEEAAIPKAEISDGDAGKMCEGSFFRWVIGYERSAAGTKKRVSQIVFRDLPAMTEGDRRAGEAWARETMQSFDP